MKPQSIAIHHIPQGGDVYDNIDIFIAHHGGQAFQITVRCYDHAWTAYRGSCGFDTIEEYFTDVWFNRGYHEHLVNLFIRNGKATKREKDWLNRIIKNMCDYFKELNNDLA